MTLERKRTKMQEVTTMIKEGRRQRKASQKSPARGGPRGNGLQVTSGFTPPVLSDGTRASAVLATVLCLVTCVQTTATMREK